MCVIFDKKWLAVDWPDPFSHEYTCRTLPFQLTWLLVDSFDCSLNWLVVQFVLSIDSLGGLSLLGSRRAICIFPEFWVVVVVIYICTFGKCISLGNGVQVVGRLVWWLA